MKVSDPPDEAKRSEGIPPRFSGAGRIWTAGTLTYTFGGLVAIFAWLLWGDFAWSVRERAIQVTVQLFFKEFGASDMFTGLCFASLPAALGMLLGPVIAYKSDRLRTRWGRRIPFLITTTPFMVLGLVGMALSPLLGGALHHFLGSHSPGLASSVLIFAGLSWVLFELSLTTANSVFGALVNDVVPQELLGRFYGLFRAVSLLVGIFFFLGVMKKVGDHYSWVFLGTAVIYGGGFTLMCLKVREGKYPPLTDASGAKKSPLSAVKTYFQDGFGHSVYVWYFAATILGTVATGPVNLFSLFYAQSLSPNLNNYWNCLGLTYFISLMLSYPIGVLADRFHPLRVTFVITACYAAAMLLSFFFVQGIHTFAIALVLHGVVVGTFNTTVASLGQRILPRSRFAEISSVGGILYNVSTMLVPPLLGAFLDYKNHDYRYIFLAASGMATLALVAFTFLYRRFMALGGPAHYRAPEPATNE